ncbi:MAG: hypothetical protein PHU88_02770 [candidate division Zixibacteria bacterium]|nr:hypothetical protein [candidate division Zixibacteria bacterium]MDD5427215.1 hypothetical protein [candidate division Zixibacteria bacterium]
MNREEDEKKNQPQPEETDAEGQVLSWRCHPVKRRPWVSLAVTLFVLLISFLVFYATGSRAFTVLALVILMASLAKFYFPTEYRLSDKNIKIKTTTQTLVKDWAMYRSFYPDKNGILLSPFARPSRLENFRGLYIMFENNRDEVTAFVKERLGRTASPALKSDDGDKEGNAASPGD